MIRNLLKISTVFVLGFLTLFTSCNKEEAETPQFVEDFVDQTVFEMQARGNCGRFGCFEFVFPITVVFEDNFSVEVDSYEALKEALIAWKTDNPDATARPTFAFPIEVVSQDGEVISVADQTDLQELRKTCRKNFFDRHGHRGHMNRGTHCFSLAFPVNVLLPDGTTSEAADKDALKEILRSWRAANGRGSDRPSLEFPLDVTMEDGSTVTLDSKEALKDLKDTCGS